MHSCVVPQEGPCRVLSPAQPGLNMESGAGRAALGREWSNLQLEKLRQGSEMPCALCRALLGCSSAVSPLRALSAAWKRSSSKGKNLSPGVFMPAPWPSPFLCAPHASACVFSSCLVWCGGPCGSRERPVIVREWVHQMQVGSFCPWRCVVFPLGPTSGHPCLVQHRISGIFCKSSLLSSALTAGRCKVFWDGHEV